MSSFPMLQRALVVLAVLFTGLIAGLMIGTGMEQYTHRALSAFGWITEHQVMDALFRRVMPVPWNATALLLVLAAVSTSGRTRVFFAVAAALLIFSLAVTVRVEVPMNREIALWNPELAPAHWSAVRDRWLSFHLLRTVCGTLAFCFALWGVVVQTVPVSVRPDRSATQPGQIPQVASIHGR